MPQSQQEHRESEVEGAALKANCLWSKNIFFLKDITWAQSHIQEYEEKFSAVVYGSSFSQLIVPTFHNTSV